MDVYFEVLYQLNMVDTGENKKMKRWKMESRRVVVVGHRLSESEY